MPTLTDRWFDPTTPGLSGRVTIAQVIGAVVGVRFEGERVGKLDSDYTRQRKAAIRPEPIENFAGAQAL